MILRIKRLLIATLVVVSFIAYYVLTDPNSSVLSNLKVGTSLILTLQIFVVAALGFWVIEVIPDFFVDVIFGKEKELIDKAKEDPKGAAIASLSKSIRILGYAIIVAASIIAFTST